MANVKIKLPESISYNKSDKPITVWKPFNGFEKTLFKSRGFKVNPNARRYFEKSKAKNKRGQSELSYPCYKNELFDDWQNRLSQYIHDGANVIVDVKTSCGKTWAVNQIVSYETLKTDDKHALMIIPNQSVLFDTVKDITENHKKSYKRDNPIVHFSTTKWASFPNSYNINSQILCLTVDTVLHYLDYSYESFFKKIKYFVFDEVHLNEISNILWKLSLIDLKAQFILLSATLGNTDVLTDNLRRYRPKTPIKILKYGVRPIPLQRLLFKTGIDLCNKGVCIRKSELDNPLAFTCQINFNDPTIRDIKKMLSMMKSKESIPYTREEQYYFGQECVEKFKNSPCYKEYLETEEKQVLESVNNWDINNILSILQNLFARDMAPTLIFNPNETECINMLKQLGNILYTKEQEDPEVKKNLREISRAEKRLKRKRDKESKFKQEAKNFAEAKLREEVDDKTIPTLLNKWRFPHNSEIKLIGKHIPDYIKLALDYGIGIHIESLNYWLKKQMFDLFREKKIKILISDIGLSVGVNLPARSVILTGEITPTLYKQMGGRAGRRGLDNMGYIIPMTNNIDSLIHSRETCRDVSKPSPFSLIDIIEFNKNNRGKTSLKYSVMKKYYHSLEEESDKDIFINKYSWLQKLGLMDCKWTEMLTTLSIDRFIIFISLLNNGVLHYLCNRELSLNEKMNNIMIVLTYLLDSNLSETSDETQKLPELPDFVNVTIEKLNRSLYGDSDDKILDISKSYDNYLLNFYKTGKYDDSNIKKIGLFQKKFFILLKIFKHMVETRFYQLGDPDILYETFQSLDSSLWSKCYSLRGIISGL